MTTLSEDEIREAMKKSLEQWGIRKSRSEDHAEFYDRAMESALLVKAGVETLNESINPSKRPQLPENLSDAFRYILSQEFDTTKECYLLCDALTDDLPNVFGPPYLLDRRQNRYKRREIFEPFKPSQLNPMNRFSEYEIPPSLYHFGMIKNENMMCGIKFETILSHYVVNSNIQCNHCKKRGTIQWFGGSSKESSWRDMVCTSCQSTYEIKSKKTTGHIQKLFKYNEIPGGSYRLFHKMLSQSQSKHYIVLISREYEWPNKGPAFYQTEIAEIDDGLPVLADRSFLHLDNPSKEISLKTLVKTKLRTWKKWLKVPAKKLNWHSLARLAYKDVYPEEDWDKLEEKNKDFFEKTEPRKAIWSSHHKKWFYKDNGNESNIAEAMQNLEIDPEVGEEKVVKGKEGDASTVNQEVELKAELDAFASITENWDDDSDDE